MLGSRGHNTKLESLDYYLTIPLQSSCKNEITKVKNLGKKAR